VRSPWGWSAINRIESITHRYLSAKPFDLCSHNPSIIDSVLFPHIPILFHSQKTKHQCINAITMTLWHQADFMKTDGKSGCICSGFVYFQSPVWGLTWRRVHFYLIKWTWSVLIYLDVSSCLLASWGSCLPWHMGIPSRSGSDLPRQNWIQFKTMHSK
jgi:hypothetical protein